MTIISGGNNNCDNNNNNNVTTPTMPLMTSINHENDGRQQYREETREKWVEKEQST